MKSIKTKLAHMLWLADGELIRHSHAVEAGIIVGKPNAVDHGWTKKRRQQGKR